MRRGHGHRHHHVEPSYLGAVRDEPAVFAEFVRTAGELAGGAHASDEVTTRA